MKRAFVAALVALVVSGPAWGKDKAVADDAKVLLHCNGWLQNTTGERHGTSQNMWISKTGSWIEYQGKRVKRFNKHGKWFYKTKGLLGDTVTINFDPDNMTQRVLTYSDQSGTSANYSCVPISKNPFDR
jgi:hypothetical protein